MSRRPQLRPGSELKNAYMIPCLSTAPPAGEKSRPQIDRTNAGSPPLASFNERECVQICLPNAFHRLALESRLSWKVLVAQECSAVPSRRGDIADVIRADSQVGSSFIYRQNPRPSLRRRPSGPKRFLDQLCFLRLPPNSGNGLRNQDRGRTPQRPFEGRLSRRDHGESCIGSIQSSRCLR